MMITFKDQGHDSCCDGDIPPVGRKLVGRRVPLSPEVSSREAEPYQMQGWKEVDGKQVYRPIQMRNYFMKKWFDWQLKGRNEVRTEMLNHPFGDDVKSLLHRGIREVATSDLR